MREHLTRRTLLIAATLAPAMQLAHSAPVMLPAAVSLQDELKLALATGQSVLTPTSTTFLHSLITRISS